MTSTSGLLSRRYSGEQQMEVAVSASARQANQAKFMRLDGQQIACAFDRPCAGPFDHACSANSAGGLLSFRRRNRYTLPAGSVFGGTISRKRDQHDIDTVLARRCLPLHKSRLGRAKTSFLKFGVFDCGLMGRGIAEVNATSSCFRHGN
jgi:hypothetical protein